LHAITLLSLRCLINLRACGELGFTNRLQRSKIIEESNGKQRELLSVKNEQNEGIQWKTKRTFECKE